MDSVVSKLQTIMGLLEQGAELHRSKKNGGGPRERYVLLRYTRRPQHHQKFRDFEVKIMAHFPLKSPSYILTYSRRGVQAHHYFKSLQTLTEHISEFLPAPPPVTTDSSFLSILDDVSKHISVLCI